MRKTITSMTLLALASLNLTAHAHITSVQKQDVEIKTSDLGHGIYMLEGRGGNIGLSVGEDGVFMIDDQFGHMAGKITEAIEKITDQPVEYVLNTHWHGDHTGGNAAFASKGATILSHDNVRKRLKLGSKERNIKPATGDALPVITFSETTTFHWNGHEIFIYHFPKAHTDGDALVFFRDVNIMHLGDTFFSRRYPFIDLASGGTVDGFIANLEKVADLSDANTTIMPGHGPVSGKDDILDMISMLKKSKSLVAPLVSQGLSEDEIVNSNPLAEFDEDYTWGFINTERMTRTIVQDLLR